VTVTPTEFIAALGPAARSSMARTGIPASAVVAQGYWESGFGNSGLAREAMNLFGVKADRSWRGPTVSMPTIEFIDGKRVQVPALWRKYGSWQESIDDHAAFFRENSRYALALQCRDGEGFVRLICAAGYDTDPNYAAGVIAVMRQHGLEALDRPQGVDPAPALVPVATPVQNAPQPPVSPPKPTPAPVITRPPQPGRLATMDAATKRYLSMGFLIVVYMGGRVLKIDDSMFYNVLLGMLGGLGVMHATLTDPNSDKSHPTT
jgi:flagellar protein FlgJ